MTKLLIDPNRLWTSLAEMARIGATEGGGVSRPALSGTDREARDLFAGWCRQAGLEVGIDRIGNMFARRTGCEPNLAPVMFGSHLDSQPAGGRFDGTLGVLTGLEVMRVLNDLGQETAAPLDLVNWTNEEGWRFLPAMIGSGAFAGVFDLDFALTRADAEGRTVAQELGQIGYNGPEPVGGRVPDAYFELHIEQGPLLDDARIPIGAVGAASGKRRFDVVIAGRAVHAATFPMDRRRDALVGAARMVDEVHRAGSVHAPAGCATVGWFQVVPGSRNVVPGQVAFSVDLRHPDEGTLAALDASLRERFTAIAGELGLALAFGEESSYPPTSFDAGCVALVCEAAREAGYNFREITSGAGHDAVYMAGVCPAAMIFVPCANGVSHAEDENVTPEAAAAGAEVLYRAVLARAGARVISA